MTKTPDVKYIGDAPEPTEIISSLKDIPEDTYVVLTWNDDCESYWYHYFLKYHPQYRADGCIDHSMCYLNIPTDAREENINRLVNEVDKYFSPEDLTLSYEGYYAALQEYSSVRFFIYDGTFSDAPYWLHYAMDQGYIKLNLEGSDEYYPKGKDGPAVPLSKGDFIVKLPHEDCPLVMSQSVFDYMFCVIPDFTDDELDEMEEEDAES